MVPAKRQSLQRQALAYRLMGEMVANDHTSISLLDVWVRARSRALSPKTAERIMPAARP